MDIFSMVLSLLCGVSMFLFGMLLMGDGLKMVAGNKLEAFLYKMTNTPLKGVALGTGVTCVIQSSSATTVMVIGFVNSGMMKLRQAIGIIMGANIGTSITGWILCLSYIDGSSGIAKVFSTATISAVVAIVGIVLRMGGRRTVQRNIGNIMLGFAILMVGMQMMSSAVEPLRESEMFINMMTMFTNPLAGILLGIVFTAIIQSASAATGVLQALSITGSVTFANAFPITLGIGIGAACPVLISAIGANKNGKRSALVYLLNDLFGMVIWGSIFYAAHAIVHFPFMNMVMGPVTVAAMNSIYRALTVCVLFWFIPKIEKLVTRLIPDTEEDLEELADSQDFDLLEERLLASPALAIGQCARAINGMAKNVRKNVGRALDLVNTYNEDKYRKIQSKEDLIDKYESKLGEYLVQIAKREMNTAQTRQVSMSLHIISDLERVGDYASNVARITSEIQEGNLILSRAAQSELNVVMSAVKESMNLTVDTLKEHDGEKAMRVKFLSAVVASLAEELKIRHVIRLSRGECELQQGTAFNELANSFERMAAHCAGAAMAVVKMDDVDSDLHIHSMATERDENTKPGERLEEYAKKYRPLLEEYRTKYDIEHIDPDYRSPEFEPIDPKKQEQSGRKRKRS